MQTPHIRMFAGPNGSEKSTLKEVIRKDLIGIYINADEIEKEIRDTSELALGRFEITSAGEELCSAIESDDGGNSNFIMTSQNYLITYWKRI